MNHVTQHMKQIIEGLNYSYTYNQSEITKLKQLMKELTDKSNEYLAMIADYQDALAKLHLTYTEDAE